MTGYREEEMWDAVCRFYTRELMQDISFRLWGRFRYRWRDGRIVFPLDREATRGAEATLQACYRFLASTAE